METTNYLPEEVNGLIAQSSISEDKLTAILGNLITAFSALNGLKKESDSIVIKDHNDEDSMKLAASLRKKIKNVRLTTVEFLKNRRKEVQQLKLDYDLEDKLYLRLTQVTEDITKNLETSLKFKEETKERYIIESQEKLRAERTSLIYEKGLGAYYTGSLDLGTISESDFELKLDELIKLKKYDELMEEKKRLAEIEAEKERERLDSIREERKSQLLDFWKFVNHADRSLDFAAITDDEFNDILTRAKYAEKAEKERERQLIEQKEKELKDRELQLEKEREENARIDEIYQKRLTIIQECNFQFVKLNLSRDIALLTDEAFNYALARKHEQEAELKALEEKRLDELKAQEEKQKAEQEAENLAKMTDAKKFALLQKDIKSIINNSYEFKYRNSVTTKKQINDYLQKCLDLIG